MTRVTYTTVELHDSQANSHKFYRSYVVDNVVVHQWGRVGTLGQFSAVQCGNKIGAEGIAEDKINEKVGGGYGGRTRGGFDYPHAIDTGDKDTLRRLGQFANSHVPSAPPAPSPAPKADPAPNPTPKVEADRYSEFTSRALAAVSLAVTAPSAAMVELALLREQWEELEQVHARAASYLDTLNTMLLSDVSA